MCACVFIYIIFCLLVFEFVSVPVGQVFKLDSFLVPPWGAPTNDVRELAEG